MSSGRLPPRLPPRRYALVTGWDTRPLFTPSLAVALMDLCTRSTIIVYIYILISLWLLWPKNNKKNFLPQALCLLL